MQRRRRLEEDQALRRSLQRRADDLGVLIEWANAGEDVGADLARGLDELQSEVDAAETKKMLGGEHDRANAIVTIETAAANAEDAREQHSRCHALGEGVRRPQVDRPLERCGRRLLLRSTYATRLSAGGVADEWVTQLLRQGDVKVFKKYSQMKLQMKREALQRLNRAANESAGVLGQAG